MGGSFVMDGSLAFGKKQRMQIKDGSLGGENSGEGRGPLSPEMGLNSLTI